jgi:solute carrier family 26 (sodium-independent sulfate anion transporter), member 11
MAVINLFGPVSLFYRYWRISMADFVASQLSFWITIFVSAEIGIGVAVAWSIVWSLLRSAFVKPDVEISSNGNTSFQSQGLDRFNTTAGDLSTIPIPSDTVVVHFNDSIFFPNAARGKRVTIEAIQLVYDKLPDSIVFRARERSWSVAAERRVERIRRERNIALRDVPLAVVIFDFTMVTWIDTTGVLALAESKADIRLHCGKEVQFRFVGINGSVRRRFARAMWTLTEFNDEHRQGVDTLYPSLERAIVDRERLGSVLEAVVEEKTID